MINDMQFFDAQIVWFSIWGSVILVAVSMLLAIMSLFGKRSFAERILAINILSTKTVIVIILFSQEVAELAWMIDLALIYVLINFLTILALLKFSGGDQ